MRIKQVIDQNRDNAGIAVLGTTLALITSSSYLWQVITALGTMMLLTIAGHFLKRELNYRFPPKRKPETGD